MSLRTLASLLQVVNAADKLQRNPAQVGPLLANTLPPLAGALVGADGQRLTQAALEAAEQRGLLAKATGWLTPPVDAEWTELSPYCTVCGPAYKPGGEARLVREIAGMAYGVIYLVGREGTGKTAAAMRLAELWDRPTYVLGIPEHALPLDWQELRIPPHVLKPARPPRAGTQWDEDDETPDEDDDEPAGTPFEAWLERTLPVGATLLIDDALLVLDSSASANTTNRVIRALIAIMRHRQMNLVVNTQVASAVSKYVLNARCLFLKPPVRRAEIIERRELQPLIAGVRDWYATMPERAWLEHAWADSETYSGPVHFSLPSFWDETLSRNKG